MWCLRMRTVIALGVLLSGQALFAADDAAGPAAQAGQGERAGMGADVEDDVGGGEARREAVLVVDDDVAEDAAVDGAGPTAPVKGGVAEELPAAVAFAEQAHAGASVRVRGGAWYESRARSGKGNRSGTIEHG